MRWSSRRSSCWPAFAAAAVVCGVSTVTVAQSVTSLSPADPARSSRLVIRGSGFGNSQGAVTINGVSAHIARWTDSRISAYIAESTPLGAGSVVVSAGGVVTAGQVDVRARPGPQDRIRWRFDGDAYYFNCRPAIGLDGAIFAADAFGTLYCLSPNGALRWTRWGVSGSKSPAVGPDGTVYVSGLGGMVTAVDPATGASIWSVPSPSNAGQVFSGPSVGPDGTIYVATDELHSAGQNFGVAAISSDGEILWNTSNNFGVRTGSFGYAWELTPAAGTVYFASGMGSPPDNTVGVFALDSSDGDIRWSTNSLMWPRLGPDGNLYVRNVDGNYFASYTPGGSERWRTVHTQIGGTPAGDIDLDPAGNFYNTSGLNLASGNSMGQHRWTRALTETTTQRVGASPNGQVVVAQCSPFSVTLSSSIRGFDPANGQQLWSQDLGFDGTQRISQHWNGRFSTDGRFWYVPCSGANGASEPVAPLFAIDTALSVGGCPVDLDGSGAADVPDLFAFLAMWFASDAAADMDGNGTIEVPDIFGFLSAWFVGC